MPRGRKPKPTAIKKLAGNPGKRKPNGEEPKLPAAAAAKPDCPPHLDGPARHEWQRVADLLHSAGLLTQVDRAALAGYCVAWGRWIQAETSLREHGPIVKSPSGYPIQNPWLSVANAALAQVQKLAAEFGMTPSSRSRVRAPEAAKAEDTQAATDAAFLD